MSNTSIIVTLFALAVIAYALRWRSRNRLLRRAIVVLINDVVGTKRSISIQYLHDRLEREFSLRDVEKGVAWLVQTSCVGRDSMGVRLKDRGHWSAIYRGVVPPGMTPDLKEVERFRDPQHIHSSLH